MLFASIGSAPNVILFVLSFAALVIVGSYTLAYAAYCYLVVAQTTSAGLDRVEWPDDPILDWIFQSLHVVGVVLIWMVPAGLLSRALSQDFLAEDAALRFLVLAVPGLWLLFPIGLLSSLASPSRWVPVSPRVIGRMFRIFPSMLLFYLITAGLFALASGLTFVGLFTSAWYALPLAAIGGSAALLIHARLLGRIGWLMGRQDNKKPVKSKSQQSQPSKKRKRLVRTPRARAARDPWAEPEGDLPEEPPSAPGYDVVEIAAEEPRPPRPSYLDPEPDPYTVAEPESEPTAPLPQPKVELEKAQIEREVKLRDRTPPNPPPALPLFSGVWTFPCYESSLKAWLWLTFSGLVCGGIVCFMISVSPFSRG